MIRRGLRHRSFDRPGHTLAELTVALPIMAMLAVGMASAVKLATKSMPDGTSASDSTLAAARALDLFAGEVAYATSFVTDVENPAAGRQLTFVIPDRDGKAPATETVTWSWSGVPGDPLLRSFNGVTSPVATDVQEFDLCYDKQVNSFPTMAHNTTAEMLLLNCDGTTSTADFAITTSNWCGQYFVPFLPSNAVGWNVTKVQFMARQNGSNSGQTAVQIRTANNKLPTSTVLDQQILLENTLTSSHTLKTLTFANVPMQSPNQGLCLVLQVAASAPTAYIQYWAGGKVNACYVSTTTSGGTWTATKTSSLRCYIYGTVTTETPSSVEQESLSSVRCTLRIGGAPHSRLTTSIRILNEPQVTGP